jgi:hypothetical protein
LERKKPLRAKKSLERKGALGRSEFKRTGSLKVGKHLKSRSKKMEKIYKERVKFVKAFLEQYPYCQIRWDAGCQRASVDVHERLFRSAGGVIVGGPEEQYVATCRYCHDTAHREPNEARKRGLKIS